MAISEFKIVIEKGPRIRVEYKTPEGASETISSDDLKIKPVHRRTTEFLIKLLRDGRLKEDWEYEVLGENLFATLFYTEDRTELNKFGQKLTDAMRNARPVTRGDEALLRITLDFQEERDLSSWPWEYLYSPDREGDTECNFFIAQRARMALTRHLALSNVPLANPAPPPLKVLLVAPSSRGLPAESTSVVEALQDLERDGTIRLKCLPPPESGNGEVGTVTFPAFRSLVDRWDPNVIHFLGHGKHEMNGDKAVGHLAFTDETGEHTKWVTDQNLANALDDYSQSLHLVFLQACETADSTSSSAYQTIAGVAQSISRRKVPAVVAMQYRVRGATANALSRAFYESLAETRSVLLALNHAREQVSDDTWGAFGLPVLYLRGAGVISVPPDAPSGSDRLLQPLPRRTQCPWDGLVEVAEAGRCPVCKRELFCPDAACRQPRTNASNKCQHCAQVTYTDALPPAARTAFEPSPQTGDAIRRDGGQGDGRQGDRRQEFGDPRGVYP